MRSKAVKWKIWIMAVLAITLALCYGMYRMYEKAYEMEDQTAQQNGVSEGFVMETFSDTFLDMEMETEDMDETVHLKEKESSEKEMYWVYVCGEVSVPGVYELTEGSRIKDAIESAGGFTEKAAREYWNLAQKIEDGMKIVVLSQEEAVADPYGIQKEGNIMRSEAGDDRVNLNHATMEQLQKLPGIGAAKASDIIEYRKANGEFSAIEDIMNVPGIKESVFEDIKDKIIV